MVMKNGDENKNSDWVGPCNAWIKYNTPLTSTKRYKNIITHGTYDGETHETGQQEEVVVQVTVVQIGGHPLVA